MFLIGALRLNYGEAQETIFGVEDWTQISFMQGKCFIFYSISTSTISPALTYTLCWKAIDPLLKIKVVHSWTLKYCRRLHVGMSIMISNRFGGEDENTSTILYSKTEKMITKYMLLVENSVAANRSSY